MPNYASKHTGQKIDQSVDDIDTVKGSYLKGSSIKNTSSDTSITVTNQDNSQKTIKVSVSGTVLSIESLETSSETSGS